MEAAVVLDEDDYAALVWGAGQFRRTGDSNRKEDRIINRGGVVFYEYESRM